MSTPIARVLLLALAGIVLAACSSPAKESTANEGGSSPTATINFDPEDIPPSGAEREFSTDFASHSIAYDEVISGGPGKDGIPAIDDPGFETVDQADQWLDDLEPVIHVEIGGEARGYPIQIMMWHEIVNDVVAGEPIAVTFCPLCNTAIAFFSTVEGQALDFGTTGRLRYSNLLMYDRQTESWWQQATGEAVIGSYTGAQLDFAAAPIISWAQFKAASPDGQVLSRDTGYARPYGNNPYLGYDNVNQSPFLYRGPSIPSDALPPMAYILAVEIGDEAVAYAYEALALTPVVHDTVGGEEIVVFWQAGTASALDTGSIANGREIGSAFAYSRQIDNQILDFISVDGRFEDQQTGSQWNLLGRAVDGELEGTQLKPVQAYGNFWFSWVVFKPETRIFSFDTYPQ